MYLSNICIGGHYLWLLFSLEFKSAFEKCDKDGSKCIDASELKEVLISLGKNPTDEEVESMIASVDYNGKEHTNIYSFVSKFLAI